MRSYSVRIYFSTSGTVPCEEFVTTWQYSISQIRVTYLYCIIIIIIISIIIIIIIIIISFMQGINAFIPETNHVPRE